MRLYSLSPMISEPPAHGGAVQALSVRWPGVIARGYGVGVGVETGGAISHCSVAIFTVAAR